MPARVLVALSAGTLLLPGGVAAADSSVQPAGDEVVGTLVVAPGDHFAAGHADEGYEIHAPGERPITLDVPDGSLDSLVGEAVLARGTVEGTTLEDAVVASAGDDGGRAVAAAGDMHAMIAGPKSVAVLLVNFSDRALQPWTPEQIDTTFFGPTGSVDAFYQTTSDAAVSLSGDVHGWYTIPYSYTACSYTTWESAARAAATAAGVNVNAYQYVVYMFPYANCAWAGLARVGASGSWINGTSSVRVIAHELGHNFGVWHSSTTTCTDTLGSRVPLSGTCTSNEYGDPFSVMGNTLRTHHAGHSHRMGWAAAPAAVTSGTHRIARLHSGGSPQLLRVPRGTMGTYFDLEVRSDLAAFDTFGSSNGVVNGLSIRVDSSGHWGNSSLLDMNPSTATFADAALPVGQTFVDPATGVSIRLDALDATGATVTVGSVTDTVPPSPPGNLRITNATTDAVTLAWNASTDDTGVLAYRIYRNSTYVSSTGSLSFTDAGLRPGTQYTWTVEAFDAAQNSTQATLSGQTASFPAPTPPAPPPSASPPPRPTPGVVTPWGPRIIRDGSLVPLAHATPSGVDVVAAAQSATGGGSWTVATNGAVYTTGDAVNFGGLDGISLNKPINAMAVTPTGRGYWLAASDGGMFAFGDAAFYGSTGAIKLNQPIVGMAPTPTNRGYWLVARDGGIFAFGDAAFYGSTGGSSTGSDISGMISSTTGRGYSLITADGRVFAFGDA